MSGAGSPTVSVVLRTYNHAPFIAQAIESVLIQRTSFPFELVIAEDCSTDETRAIVTDYAERKPEQVRAVLPERNVGHGEILRQGLEAAAGSYVAYLDGDDYWTSPSKLARQVDFLERNKECATCFHDVSVVYDEAGLPSGALSPRLGEERFTLEQILMECFVPAPSMMFRREVAEELPSWVFESMWIDWLIHIRSAQLGPIGYLPEALAAYRVPRGGMFSALDRVSQLEEDLRFYERLLPDLPEQRELIERCLAYRHAQLAIERLGVPFDACVVLVDPRRELRPYFNGRHARNLPRREGREVTELEAIREAAKDLSAAVQDYGPPTQLLDGHRGCYVVVPRAAADWLAERSQFVAYLNENAQVAWADEWAVVHELGALTGKGDKQGSRAARRVEVTMLPSSSGLAGFYLDAPASGALLPAHAVTVVGWVLGVDSLPVMIEFEVDGELLWRAPVHLERPDVAEAFPDLSVKKPGFQTTLNAQEVPAGAVTTAFAILSDGTRSPFAELRFHSHGDDEPGAA